MRQAATGCMDQRFARTVPAAGLTTAARLIPLAILMLVCACGPRVPEGAAAPNAASGDTVAAPTVAYHCDSGAEIRASYLAQDSAVVTYRGRTHRMARAISADGGRYVGDGLQWWIKAFPDREEGTLGRLQPGEQVAREVLERCRLEPNG